MTFDDIKAEILSRAKRLEMCDQFQAVILSTTETELITAALTPTSLGVWAYQAGIVDDALLAEFDQANLNALNIYCTGSFSFDDPTTEVFILGDANCLILVASTNKAKINCLGSCVVTVTQKEQSFVDLHSYQNSTVTVNIQSNTSCNHEMAQNSVNDVTLQNNSIYNAITRSESALTIVSKNDSFGRIRGFGNSSITFSTEDSGEVVIEPHQSCTVNGVYP